MKGNFLELKMQHFEIKRYRIVKLNFMTYLSKLTSLLNFIKIMDEHNIFITELCKMYMEDHEELSWSFMWAKGVWKMESKCTQILNNFT